MYDWLLSELSIAAITTVGCLTPQYLIAVGLARSGISLNTDSEHPGASRFTDTFQSFQPLKKILLQTQKVPIVGRSIIAPMAEDIVAFGPGILGMLVHPILGGSLFTAFGTTWILMHEHSSLARHILMAIDVAAGVLLSIKGHYPAIFFRHILHNALLDFDVWRRGIVDE